MRAHGGQPTADPHLQLSLIRHTNTTITTNQPIITADPPPTLPFNFEPNPKRSLNHNIHTTHLSKSMP
jgi:hypothetical protein